MMNYQDLTKDEDSLLQYLETCIVDQSGKIDTRKMNDVDWEIVKQWTKTGFIKVGRMPGLWILDTDYPQYSHWVVLSDEALHLAHECRKARAKRGEQRLSDLLEEYGKTVGE